MQIQGTTRQIELFKELGQIYAAAGGQASNEHLYQELVRRGQITEADLARVETVGSQRFNPIKRAIRWHQQTLKHMGVLERAPDMRGYWGLTKPAKQELTKATRRMRLLGFATDLGLAIWGDAHAVFSDLNEPIALAITSPPYPLRKSRAYGGPKGERAYIEFIIRTLEPLVRNLKRGGSIVLNISNDCFEKGLPARSLYRERLVLALYERLGLYKMDEIPWVNLSKPPGPVHWASKKRVQLNVGWEPIYWFTNDPAHVASDNRRVLQPHTERQLKLIEQGGERREVANSDGAYVIKEGSYGNRTDGRIMKNVYIRGHRCASQSAYKRACRDLGLPAHGAPFPVDMVRDFIRFLCVPGELVVDPCAGSFSTGVAAEEAGCRWIGTDHILEYVRGGATRYEDRPGFVLNPAMDDVLAWRRAA